MTKAAILPEAETEAEGKEEANENLGAFKDFVDSLDFEDIDKKKGDEDDEK